MGDQGISSFLLQEAVEALSRLPGVGGKTALRLALHLLRQPESEARRLSEALLKMRTEIRYCKVCNMISDTELCPICQGPKRDRSIICVVEDIRDVMSIEHTGRYRGLYHVLGGIISPINGVGPTDLSIPALLERLKDPELKEVLLALSTTMEGETTCFYLYKLIEPHGLQVTTIARGIGFGDDLEYTDELTLGKSIENRQAFRPV